MLYIYDTYRKSKVEFKPLVEGRVSMYVCGPTVYNYIHLGNARPAVVFDSFRRFLEYIGYKVTSVQNFTDIDDKIINEANEWKVDFHDVAETFISEYWRDASLLGIRAPSFSPKTTNYINEIITIIKGLINKGYAYEKDGDVYFKVRAFKDYGKLSGRKIDDLVAGARIDVNEKKIDPADFAVWKAAKPGEPSWQSPWGQGRPGWHIECSAMSMNLLGETLDIHAGGEDLIFPHHEDEKAQSEAFTGKTFANYWMHNAMIITHGDKMSKSVGNVFLVREAVKQFGKEAVKLFLLSKHYRSPIEYSPELLSDNKLAADRVWSSLERFEEKYPYPRIPARDAWINDCESKMIDGLEDDFNTPILIGLLFDGVKLLNKSMDSGDDETALKAYHVIRRIYTPILGIFEGKRTTESGKTDEIMNAILNARNELRKRRDYEAADVIRDNLTKAGIDLKDTPEGTKYSI